MVPRRPCPPNPNGHQGSSARIQRNRVMDKAPTFVGIDVSKRRLDIHSRPSGEGFTIDHDDDGVAALVERLAALAPTLVVLEATGGLEVRLAAALAAAGLPVAVVNPRRVRAFARATGRLGKNRPPRAGGPLPAAGGGGWPSPTASTRRRSPASPRRCGRRRGPCRTRPPATS